MARTKARTKSAGAARILRTLEVRLAAIDRNLLMTVSGGAPTASPPAELRQRKPRLTFQPIESEAKVAARLRLTAPPSDIERVVIQNWNPRPGFLPIGEVEVELEPGQTVTLWMNRGSTPPVPHEDGGEPFHSSLCILSEDQHLPI